MKRTLFATVLSIGWALAAFAADPADKDKDKEGNGSSSNTNRKPGTKAPQEEANFFFGKTEQELVAAIGNPFEIRLVTAPSGAFLRYLMYVSDSKYETWFLIPSSKDSVVGGEFQGTRVIDPKWVSPSGKGASKSIGGATGTIR